MSSSPLVRNPPANQWYPVGPLRPEVAQAQMVQMSPFSTRIADQVTARYYPEYANRRPNPASTNPRERAAAQAWSSAWTSARNVERERAGQAAPGQTTLPCQAQTPCEIEKVEVKCQHHDEGPAKDRRKFVAVVGVGANTQEYQVATGNREGDKVKVKTVVKKPLCNAKEHRTKHYRLTNSGQTQTFAAPQFEFEAKHPLRLHVAGAAPNIPALWRSLRPLAEAGHEYQVEAQACKGAATTKIKVTAFPAVEWEIKFGLRASSAQSVNLPARGGVSGTAADTDGVALNLEAKVEYDGGAFVFGRELKSEFSRKQPWVHAVMKMGTWLKKFLYLAGNINIIFPEVNIEGTYKSKVKEHPDQWRVYNNTEFTFGGNPILGGTLEFEFIDAILRAAGNILAACGIVVAPAVAQFLIQLRRRFAEGIGNDDSMFAARATLSAKLCISGSLSMGALSVEHEWGVRKKLEVSPVSGKLTFKVRGELSAMGRAWIVTVSAGGSAEGTASVEVGLWAGEWVEKGVKTSGLKGGIRFGGMKIEIQGWVSVKVDGWLWSTTRQEQYKKEIEILGKSEWHPSWLSVIRQ
ncbi:MAG: hypothetical protein JNK72_15495 [Myxococcales bacterium]|nr:hypothetical protein [Myxococcales bacterium]